MLRLIAEMNRRQRQLHGEEEEEEESTKQTYSATCDMDAAVKLRLQVVVAESDGLQNNVYTGTASQVVVSHPVQTTNRL